MSNPRIDGTARSESVSHDIAAACDWMERVYDAGRYCKISVHRNWSKHNPTICGKVAYPSAIRWYLQRELFRLANKGAVIEFEPSRERIDLSSPLLLEKIDQAWFDQTKKKVFLFGPERTELSIARLQHYCGTPIEAFQRYVLLTNYQMHMDAFEQMFPNCVRPSKTVQMPALHQRTNDNSGITIVNIGVGPSNAKNLTDHLAVLRPDAMIMVGHCAGVRNHQDIGDFVLASGYMRDDRVLDKALPMSVPVTPSFILNRYLAKVLDDNSLTYRHGIVMTTADRNWEMSISSAMVHLQASRSIAVDMESATVAANGFRYRIPSATLLCISDKPLHGRPKLPDAAQAFYADTKAQHLEVARAALSLVKQHYQGGLPSTDLRAMDEPLFGSDA